MKKFYSAVINSDGKAMPNMVVKVYKNNTLELATIYYDEGITLKDNPFTTDVNGRFEFYAPDGDYDIEISGEGIESYKITDITIVDTKEAVELKHTHENKETLDLIDTEFTITLKTLYDNAVNQSHYHSNKDILDQIEEVPSDSKQVLQPLWYLIY